MSEKVLGLIMILTIGPYMIMWDCLKDGSPNSGHTSGIGDGFLRIIAAGVIFIHVVLACMFAIPYFVLSK